MPVTSRHDRAIRPHVTSMSRSLDPPTRSRLRRIFVAVALGGLVAPVPAVAADAVPSVRSADAAPFVPGELIVRPADGTTFADFERALSAHGVEVRSRHASLGVVLVGVAEGAERETAVALEAEDAVDDAETNARVTVAAARPDDPRWEEQWGPAAIEATEAWRLHPGTFSGNQGPAATGVPVAVVDTGIFAGHPDLDDGRVRTDLGAYCVGDDWVCGPGSTDDDFGHGTSIAGVISAAADNGVGVAGVAYTSPLIPVRIFDQYLNGSVLGAANGIAWGVDQGAKIVNASFVTEAGQYSQTLCDAVADAVVNHDAVVVAPAGNDHAETVRYPAGCPDALAVSGTELQDEGVEQFGDGFSNWGEHVFVAAPGGAVLGAVPYDGHDEGFTDPSGYLPVTGTSMATPHVAAVAALLASRGPGMDTPAQDIIDRIAQTTDKLGSFEYVPETDGVRIPCAGGRNSVFGHGRINARRALGVATTSAPFRLTVTPAVEVVRGETAVYDVVPHGVSGLSDPLTYSVSGLPDGATVSWAPDAATGGQTLSVAVDETVAPGRHPVVVGATNGVETASAPTYLCTPDFSLAAAPARETVMQGAGRQFDVTVDWRVGAGDVDLGIPGLPEGTSASFTPDPASMQSTLTIVTSSGTPVGVHQLTVHGTAHGLERTATVELDVSEPRTGTRRYVAAGGDFVLHCEQSYGGACFPLQGNESVVDITVQDDAGWGVGGVLEFATGWDSPIRRIPFCGSPQLQAVPDGAEMVIVRFRATEAPSNCGPATMGTVTAAFN